MTHDECRSEGQRLFALFDSCQRRLIEAEVVLGLGRKNAEERARLRSVVQALRAWMHATQRLGLLAEFDKEIRLFLDYLRHEAQEQASADKVELPWRTRLFLESGEDVVTATRKTVQHLDFDPTRLY